MEVGAVLQAFNNELIHMKKKLNQAKIQIIHNLTRKAKTLTQKKTPEHLKEKIERKAKAAVNEVLILKKLQVKEVAKFAITHTGQLKDYLNKPNVDKEKACARLLLHKSLEDKYDFLRTRFSKLPAEDLLRSRDERKKIKKEQREKQKNKQKEKQERQNKKKLAGTAGDWTVEDIEDVSNKNMGRKLTKKLNVDEKSDYDKGLLDNGDKRSDNESDNVDNGINESDNESDIVDHDQSSNDTNIGNEDVNDIQQEDIESENDHEDNDVKPVNDIDNDDDESMSDVAEAEPEIKHNDETVSLVQSYNSRVTNSAPKSSKVNQSKKIPANKHKPTKEDNRKKIPKKQDTNKKKKKTEKMQTRKFKKELNDTAPIESNKIVDPFFITASGQNYMTLAEPRAPDEVKEEHRKGNRNMRRAAMFGYEPKYKPRQNNYNNNNHGQQNRFGKQNGFQKNNKFNKQPFANDRGTKRPREDNLTSNFSKTPRDNNFKSKTVESFEKPAPPEKLHPSWEAKKKQSGIMPFQGKKIVFN